jgi:hypothetical protein
MLDAGALITEHHGRGVFIDTNLLVLLLVGLVNPGRISKFKRTQDFSIDDFRVLRKLVEWFGKPLVATPHVLSQVSDLTDLSGREAIRARELFRSTVDDIEEQHDNARRLVLHPLFERFGLGDASVAEVCARDIVVRTADVQLQIALASMGLDAINFNHVRPLGWS